MRNRFSEIFRKRLRKNCEIIFTLTYIERKCGLIYIKKFDNSHILRMSNEKLRRKFKSFQGKNWAKRKTYLK